MSLTAFTIFAALSVTMKLTLSLNPNMSTSVVTSVKILSEVGGQEMTASQQNYLEIQFLG